MNNELTAAQATIEKCREITGCPDGVDLQDHLRQLAAENVGLNSFIVDACWIVDDGQYCDATDFMPETPATDRIVAEAEARGVEKAIAHLEKKFSNIGVQIMNLQWLADSLREGAK